MGFSRKWINTEMKEVHALDKEQETWAYYKCKNHLDLGSGIRKIPEFYYMDRIQAHHNLIANNVM